MIKVPKLAPFTASLNLAKSLIEESQPDNPFSFVLSRGGAHAPQAPVIAGKAEAWKTPADD